MRQIMKWPVLLAALCGITFSGFAQSSVVMKDTVVKTKTKVMPVQHPKRPKQIDREFSVGYRFMTNGWAVFAEKGYVRSAEKNSDMFHNVRLFQVELNEVKHPKQLKRSNNQYTGSSDRAAKPFVYGKINNLYALKLGYGGRKMIAGKPEQGTISIHWVYVGGLSIGLLKPYYVDAYVGGTNEKEIKFADDPATFLHKQDIVGAVSPFKGLNEITFVPGIHVKTGLHFDFANNKRRVLAVETGFDAQYYTQEIQLMANNDPTSYFVNFYASIQFGRRK
jgi:hypothetical protein